MLNPPSTEEFPNWINIPEKYFELLTYDQDELLPWYLFDKDDLFFRYHGLQERYPNRVLFPFARHDCSDDVACWEKGKDGKVISIHDFATPGWENRFEFPSFDDWYEFVFNMKE
jgi:hypothetical protein